MLYRRGGEGCQSQQSLSLDPGVVAHQQRKRRDQVVPGVSVWRSALGLPPWPPPPLGEDKSFPGPQPLMRPGRVRISSVCPQLTSDLSPDVGGPADPIAPTIIIPPKNTSVVAGTSEVTLECVANARWVVPLPSLLRLKLQLLLPNCGLQGEQPEATSPEIQDGGGGVRETRWLLSEGCCVQPASARSLQPKKRKPGPGWKLQGRGRQPGTYGTGGRVDSLLTLGGAQREQVASQSRARLHAGVGRREVCMGNSSHGC